MATDKNHWGVEYTCGCGATFCDGRTHSTCYATRREAIEFITNSLNTTKSNDITYRLVEHKGPFTPEEADEGEYTVLWFPISELAEILSQANIA